VLPSCYVRPGRPTTWRLHTDAAVLVISRLDYCNSVMAIGSIVFHQRLRDHVTTSQAQRQRGATAWPPVEKLPPPLGGYRTNNLTNTVVRCDILRLKCTKFDFRWGSAPRPRQVNLQHSAVGYQTQANCSHPSCLCSPSSEIGSSPLKGCEGNCGHGGK